MFNNSRESCFEYDIYGDRWEKLPTIEGQGPSSICTISNQFIYAFFEEEVNIFKLDTF